MKYDVTIIGGGIIGLATGYQLLKRNPSLRVIILEKELEIGQHQTGNNSGVIHSGIYYKTGSLKAQNCRRGIDLLLNFCDKHDIIYDVCGKIIIAKDDEELNTLNLLHNRGAENGIRGLKRISKDELKEYEPHAAGLAALHCPETGIIDYFQVCRKLSERIQENGAIETGAHIIDIKDRPDGIIVFTETNKYETRFLINCAGLFSDKIAELVGIERQVRIIPFRGEYYMLKKKARHLVKNLIYPVPDPRYPFLGVHFTRTIDGRIEAGPNAVLAWAREGYKKTDINLKEIWDYLSYTGFWRMTGKYWATGVEEYYRSFSKAAFVHKLQRLVPEIRADDITSSTAGVRAQALSSNGSLIDDFMISENTKMIHVINAPSPAATSSLAIGEKIVNIYLETKL